MTQRRQIRLTFVNTGESAVAELLEEDAASVCDLVWERLPLENKVIHGMFSGAEIFMLLDDPRPAPPENMMHLPVPGELFYFYDPGQAGTSGGQPCAEICVVYDRGVMLKGPDGLPVYTPLFARIPGDWERDWVDFAQACRRVRWEGPQVLRLERVEETVTVPRRRRIPSTSVSECSEE